VSVFQRINKRSAEKRATGWDVLRDGQFGIPETYSGKRVDEEVALKFSVVWSAATLITDAVAYLTPEAYTVDVDGQTQIQPVPTWVLRPHPEIRRGDVWSQILLGAVLWGNGYALKVHRESDGAIVGLIPLDPSGVQCEWVPDSYKKRYKLPGMAADKWLYSGDIFHVQGPTLPGHATGMSVVAQARESIALGMTLEEFAARYFGQGSMQKVVIEVPGSLTETQALDLVKTYERFHKGAENWHRPAVVSGGGKLVNISIPPEDAQFLQSREFQALDVARWFRVPPHVVGIMTKQSSWGSGLAEENMAMVQRTFRPWIRRLEDALTADMPGGEDRGLRIRLRDDELLRGTFKEQGEAWATLVEKRIATPNEARKPLGLPPIEGGEDLIEPPQPFGGGEDPKAEPGAPGKRYNKYHDPKGRFDTGYAAVDAGPDTYGMLTDAQKAMVDQNLANYGVTQQDLVDEIDSRLTEEGLTEAAKWYPAAHDFNQAVADHYGLTLSQTTGMTAALSPRTRWSSEGGKYKWNNRALTIHAAAHRNDHPEMSDMQAAKAMGGTLPNNLGLAVGIARGNKSANDIGGVKRRSFYNNMMDPNGSQSVTVDTWMTQAIFNRSPIFRGTNVSTNTEGPAFLSGSGSKLKGMGGSKGDLEPGYVSIADAVRTVAAARHLPPTVVQTAYWNYARSIGNQGNKGRRVDAN
jgi:HK97 family phage portal protein